MGLCALLEPAVPRAVRARGLDLALAGRVKRVRLPVPNAVEAEVGGTRRYDTRLLVDEDTALWGSCSCPAFEGYGACKHLWALAWEGDRRQLRLVPAPLPDGSDDLEILAEDAVDDDETDRAHLDLARLATEVRPARVPDFRARLDGLVARAAPERQAFAGLEEPNDRVLYAIDVESARRHGRFRLDVLWQTRLARGGWSVARPLDAARTALRWDPAPEDRVALALLEPTADAWRNPWARPGPAVVSRALAETALLDHLPALCRAGQLTVRASADHAPSEPLELDEGPPWRLCLRLTGGRDGKRVVVEGVLVRDGERRALAEPDILLERGLLVLDGRLAGFDHGGAMPWVTALRLHGPLDGPARARDEVIGLLLALPGPPLLEIERLPRPRAVAPVPRLHVEGPDRTGGRLRELPCRIHFVYDGASVGAAEARALLLDPDGNPVRRDPELERRALGRFLEAGGRAAAPGNTRFDGHVPTKSLPEIVRTLLGEGWQVEADGRRYRAPGAFHLSVRSGVDWFDLEGVMDFDGEPVPLPSLLEAARAADGVVRLGDGSLGLLPERWLESWGLALALATEEGAGLRFRSSQAWLLDALLADRQGVAVDRQFQRLRRRLRTFDGVDPETEPDSFEGELRPYQREGLGWLRFLERTGLGGCLADDMGLGKTVQVLALLDGQRRGGARKRRPSLVVAPRSVVFNWVEEAARFAPHLRVLDYTGLDRREARSRIGEHDLVLTTYGTLRRDVVDLREIAFDYVVLDEAQAIKNPQSQSAKAARLLDAQHRLALSGTPIENHLGELWSLFEFLNPGMLGPRARVSVAFAAGNGRRARAGRPQRASRAAVRPFVLRRTKEQVARRPARQGRADAPLRASGPAQRSEYESCAITTARRWRPRRAPRPCRR